MVAARKPARKRVLFAAELGAGYGNVSPLIAVAAELEKLGVEPVFAVADGVTPALLFADRQWLRLPAPVHPSPLKPKVGPTSYGDILALAGFADEDDLTAIAAQWDALYALVRPSFVVASHAPGAVFAARGRLPVAVVGTGFTAPPCHTALFPPLRPDTASVRPESAVLECVNRVLRKRRAPVLPTLPALLDVEARAVFTIAALDPYASMRLDRYASVGAPYAAAAPESEGIFAFLDMRGKEAVNAVEVLGRLAGQTRVGVHLRGPGARASAGYLDRLGAHVHARPADMAEALSRATVVVSQGGHGMALTALQRGRYNLVLPLHFESMLNGLAAERLGAGKVAWGGATDVIADHLTGLLRLPVETALRVGERLDRPASFDAQALLDRLSAAAARPARGRAAASAARAR